MASKLKSQRSYIVSILTLCCEFWQILLIFAVELISPGVSF